MPRTPHDPARLSTYLRVHENRLAQVLASGFVSSETLSLAPLSGMLRLYGELACLGCILVRVDKYIRVLGADEDPEVQTTHYSYNASVQGFGSIFRHDNAHVHPGHADEHHRHDFDWRTGADVDDSPTWVGVHGWPTLGTFVEYVETWYWQNRGALPNPDAFPTLGVGRPF